MYVCWGYVVEEEWAAEKETSVPAATGGWAGKFYNVFALEKIIYIKNLNLAIKLFPCIYTSEARKELKKREMKSVKFMNEICLSFIFD